MDKTNSSETGQDEYSKIKWLTKGFIIFMFLKILI
jgi:hypothetical protein